MADDSAHRPKPIIRASEIGRFIYCNRAWWYDRRGVAPANMRELERGAAYHRQHGQALRRANALRALALLLLLAGLLLAILYVLSQVF
jgi:hypothetical protein